MLLAPMDLGRHRYINDGQNQIESSSTAYKSSIRLGLRRESIGATDWNELYNCITKKREKKMMTMNFIRLSALSLESEFNLLAEGLQSPH